MQERLQQTYGSRYRLLTVSHRDLRNGILRIFDETFALTYALEGVAVVVAVFGIITTFLVLIMERERELALLQALGASRRQILGMVLVESGLASRPELRPGGPGRLARCPCSSSWSSTSRPLAGPFAFTSLRASTGRPCSW